MGSGKSHVCSIGTSLSFETVSVSRVLQLERLLRLVNRIFGESISQSKIICRIGIDLGDYRRIESELIKEGSILPVIFNLSGFQVIDLSYNQLSGSIPRDIRNLTMLRKIYFDHNNFIVLEIPNEIGGLNKQEILFVQYNALEGNVPIYTTKISILRVQPVECHNTIYLLGTFKFVISKLVIKSSKRCYSYRFINNHLSGSIPRTIGNLQTLSNLSLANNKIEGLIPTSLGKSLSLEILDLSKNNLSGTIPKSLESLKYLQILNLSFNMLQGEIPMGGPFQNFSFQSFVSSRKLCGAPLLRVPARKNSTCTFKRKSMVVARETILSPQLPWRRVSHLELVRATNAFDESNLLGSGGFGSMYKGTFPNGIDVAIKIFNLEVKGLSRVLILKYGMERIVTRRGDVYSFGIVLMETFIGKKPTNEMFDGQINLKQWVANSPLRDVLDASLQVTKVENHDFVKNNECLSSIMRLALACSAESLEESEYARGRF
ncbi:receptor kinase-like protein Xa21 [Argentina anserina]|uniref:receptor kinase-like protein Xa21 n=1 Tax=Argentina anserina TaxID=57926 RepID=UPI0021767E03|nr:receptor kinase-like protein Xa21 [Potentilla anserina]